MQGRTEIIDTEKEPGLRPFDGLLQLHQLLHTQKAGCSCTARRTTRHQLMISV